MLSASEARSNAFSKVVEMALTFTSEVGDNSDLIAHVAEMYLKPKWKIADVTYGKGVFWRNIDKSKYNLSASDILTVPPFLDFRKLPYKDGEFDCVVLDPPYVHNPGKLIVNANYKNAETTKGMYHNDIIQLYVEGMKEAFRILRIGGLLWVKCKDEVESSFQRWSHIEIYAHAIGLGFFAEDLFILTQKVKPIVQHKKQCHARKNHSYLWVFKKPDARELTASLRVGRSMVRKSDCSLPQGTTTLRQTPSEPGERRC